MIRQTAYVESANASGNGTVRPWLPFRNPEAFRRLSPDFGGKKVTGLGFDRDTLHQAGIDDTFGFAAVSDGDNSNILAARVVRETYGIENVVARIYDPHRAEIGNDRVIGSHRSWPR